MLNALHALCFGPERSPPSIRRLPPSTAPRLSVLNRPNTSYLTPSPKSSALLEGFPNELIVLIFSFLDVNDLIKVRRVSKKWRVLTFEVSLWKGILKEDALYCENNQESMEQFYIKRVNTPQNLNAKLIIFFKEAAKNQDKLSHLYYVSASEKKSNLYLIVSKTDEEVNFRDYICRDIAERVEIIGTGGVDYASCRQDDNGVYYFLVNGFKCSYTIHYLDHDLTELIYDVAKRNLS